MSGPVRSAGRHLRTAARLLARHARRLARVVAFTGYFLRELVVATAVVLGDIAAPRRLCPGIVEVPLAGRTDRQVALLTALLALVPGTLPLAVRRDPPVLWIHGMHAGDREAFRRQVRAFEERMLHALGGGGR